MFRSKAILAAAVAALLATAPAPRSYGAGHVRKALKTSDGFRLILSAKGTFSQTIPPFTTAFAASDCAKKAGLVCNDGDACQCIAATAEVKGAHGLNEGSLTLFISADTNTAANNGSGGVCLPASGTGLVTGQDGEKTISFDTTGMFCNSPSLRAIYSGGYAVMAGSGSFAGADGNGAVNLSLQFTSKDAASSFPNGGNIQALLNGTLTSSD